MAEPRPQISIESRVASMEEAVVGLRTGFEALRVDVKALGAQFAAGQRPNWGVYAAFAAIALTLTAGGVAYVDKSVGRTDSAIVKMADANLIAEYQRGRADESREERQREIDELKRMDDALDVRLQREMRDVNATTEAKLEALDKRIQEEISRNALERRYQLDLMRDTVEKNESLALDSAIDRADLAARVKALESPVP